MWLRYSTLLLLQSENTGSLVTEYYIGPFFWLVGFLVLVLGFFFTFLLDAEMYSVMLSSDT